jgi:Fe-S oxidoreductase
VLITLIIGLLGTAVGLAIAGRRVWWLKNLISSGQPASGRLDGVSGRVKAHLLEVFGHRKLLKWSIPGLAHFFTFWAFVILATVYLEAYGALFSAEFAIPLVGTWPVLGFLQDFIAVAVLLSLIAFAILRVQQAPEREERKSRFYGSHLGGAWLILFMIFNVVWTMFLFRGAASAAGHFPYDSGAFVSLGLGALMEPLGQDANFVLDRVGLLAHIGVMLVFLVIVLHSKHLHIFLAPINVTTKRVPDGLGELLPMESDGKPIDFEDPDEDAVFGRGKIEDFTWKGMLDFATCTECGRCQSQCPAWNTDKPLSPKLVIMNLRDHLFAKAPYLIEGKEAPEEGSVKIESNGHDGHGVPESGFERVMGSGPEQAARPLVGDAASGGVIDPDVLWSCTTCGACVEQCPVDIEHVDHIVDMRRYQVMIESEFPGELGTLFRNLENKGNPWGQNNSERMDWAKDLDFEVPVYDGDLPDDVEYLYWIGCAGSFDDNAKKTVQATAELLHRADVKYVVLGKEETCTGDSARRAGNEFLFQMMAQQTVEMLNSVFEGREPVKRKIVTTCPHCMNTLGREYPQLDGHYEVVHHTQLLNKLVRDRKLVPIAPVEGTTVNGVGPVEPKPVTYHDPCYLGRHNKVYTPPRELIEATGMKHAEMPRHADTSLCCGAGGARMWMEEHIGKRINLERVDEAIETLGAADSGEGTVVTGCPFCKVMVSDGLTQRSSEDTGTGVGVKDVSQLLLESVKRGDAVPAAAATAAATAVAEAPSEPSAGADGGSGSSDNPS